MARFIDADRFAMRIKLSPAFKNAGHEGDLLQRVVLDLLGNAPTADVVEVVRCKDCKHRIEFYRGAYVCLLQATPKYVQLCHFCSYGGRRENSERM